MFAESLRFALLMLATFLLFSPPSENSQVTSQSRHWSGQGVAPVYEGFDINPDGTYNLWFGYMNRNYEEEIDVDVGPNNSISPGGDRGQPTHFSPRRNKDVFSVVVPKDFGDNKVVWSITVRGKTETVAGTINRVWQIDRRRTTRGGNSENINSNTPPIVDVRPIEQTIPLQASATLNVSASDDGLPKRGGKPVGMTVEWALYRGPGTVVLMPEKQPLIDGKAVTTASFSKPGEYLLIAVTDDGSGESAGNYGYHCCWTNMQVKVIVR